MKLRPDDRVLLLAIPSQDEIARLSGVLTVGLLVALGTAEDVDTARAGVARLENVMFLNARPDAIPWRDAFFTTIVVPPHLESLLRSSADELHRVLAPGGQIIRDRQDC